MTTPTAADKERAFEILHRRSALNAEQSGWWEDSAALIAQALADERERAAKVAEDHRSLGGSNMGIATRVAHEIRSQA